MKENKVLNITNGLCGLINLFLIQVPGIAFKYAEAIIKMKASQVKILIISVKIKVEL